MYTTRVIRAITPLPFVDVYMDPFASPSALIGDEDLELGLEDDEISDADDSALLFWNMVNEENMFRIADEELQLWDRAVPLTFYEGGVEVPAAEILHINYLYGIVIFASTREEDITVTGTALVLEEMSRVRSYSLALSATMLDTTGFLEARTNGGYHERLAGLFDGELTLERLTPITSEEFSTELRNRHSFVAEITPSVGDAFRGWFKPTTLRGRGSVDELEIVEIDAKLDGKDSSSFGWYSDL